MDAKVTVTSNAQAADASQQLHAVVVGDGQFATHTLPARGAADLGRGPDCDVVVQDASVSRRHLRLHLGDQLAVEDLGSKNGTTVRGELCAPGQRVAVSPGEPFRAGSVTVVLHRGPAAARPRRLWTHAYFEGKLDEECARAERSGTRFALLRVHCRDAAHVGAVLDVLFELLEPVDVVGSYAPAEYEVLLADAGEEEAERAAGRLRRRLDELGIPAGIGLAAWPRHGRSPYTLFAAADDAARGVARSPGDPLAPVIADARMRELWHLAEQAAASQASVLLLGETGVGKEVFASGIHRASPRRDGPLVCLSCAALSESLVESELFGHERGAFTGAQTSKPGLLETAGGGTVFLDEIGELSPALQVKLLRVLEERKVLRVGGLQPIPIDVRFVAATNRDLSAEMARGSFRNDLFYRIAGFTLTIPPLRERLADIEPLARVFVERAARLEQRPVPHLSEEAIAALRRHPWPGNIRELKAAIERAVLLSTRGTIGPEHLPFGDDGAWPGPAPATPAQTTAGDDGVDLSHLPEEEREEARRCIRVLAEHGGNQTRAARALGIARRTLVYRLDRYRIRRPRK
ncbi:MAG TPA: sigma 54-interacting transcriptional regulator [Kofleriaceae bacterium]|nr:sigma 54-interacting transcriptional regulator [Kofleriaceae bacterium]